MAQLIEWIVWALFAIVKFAVTPSAMIATGYGFLHSFLVSGIGATVGVITFYYVGHAIFDFFGRLFKSKKKKSIIFTKKNRRIVRFKQLYGLSGLALVSVIISVPLSGILAGKYFRHSRIALPVLIIAYWTWALVLTYISWTIKNHV